MKFRQLALVFAIFALMLLCGGAGILTSTAEVTPADVTIELRNSGVLLTGQSYQPQKIGDTDYFEFDYIDGMAISLKGTFPSSLGTYTGTSIRKDGMSYPNNINAVGVYSLVAVVDYNDQGIPKTVTKNVVITVRKATLNIVFDVTERYFKDAVGGASAHYSNKPSSVQNSSLKYTYYADEALTVPVGIPENAGTYYVRAYYEDVNNPNYEGQNTSVFTINPSAAVIIAESGEVAYSGEEIDPRHKLSADVEGDIIAPQYYAEVFLSGVWVQGNVTDAGEYQVRFRFAGSLANYASPYSNEYTLVVRKADTHFVKEDLTFEYSGASVDASSQLGSKIIFKNADYNTEIISGFGVLTYTYYKDGEPIAAPSEIGEYALRIEFAGTDNYNASDSGMIPLSIARKRIVFDIEGNYDPIEDTLTEQYTGEGFAVIYYLLDAELNGVSQVVEEESVDYYRIIGSASGDTHVLLEELPVVPGEYRVVIEVTTAHYYGIKELKLIIEKITLPESIALMYGDSIFEGAAIIYSAAPVEFLPVVPVIYDINGFVIEFEGRGATSYSRKAQAPQHAGTYTIHVELDSDIYYGSLSVDFTISKRIITVTPNDVSVVYGDRIYIVSGTLLYQAGNVTVTGLADGDTAASIVNYIRITIGDSALTQTNATISVGEYSLRTALRTDITHPSYIIDVDNSDAGVLTVTKRNLFVSMNDIAVIAGHSVAPTIKEITNFAYSDSLSNELRNAIQWDYYEGDSLLDAPPDRIGTYSIVAKGELANYIVNSINGTLTLCKASLADGNSLPFSAEGKFAPSQTLEVVYGSVTNAIKLAVSEKFEKHQAVRVINVTQKASTADGSRLTVYIDVSDLAKSSNYKVLARYGNAYTEVDFVLNGSTIEISELLMADSYIVCDVTRIDVMWYILAGAIALAVLVIGGTIFRIYYTGGFKKKHKEKGKIVQVQSKGKKSKDDEELEQLLQDFDESKVVREMTPAERLEKKRREDKFEQYRLKLQRLRASGDKALEDSLMASGVKNIDDEMIIQRMIEEDETRALRLEEEARLEKEAAERAKEKPKAVILPKNTDSYEQKSFAPKAKNDDDLDVDI